MWYEEEIGEGKNKDAMTSIQEAATNKAKKYREKLLELEENKQLKGLINADQEGQAGAWEAYKLAKVEQDIMRKSNAIYEEQKREARAWSERNWWQKLWGISNYDSKYDQLEKVTMEDLNKKYKLQAAYAYAVKEGRSIFEDEIELKDEEFKIKPKPGQILKKEYDIRQLELDTLNGVYYEKYKKHTDFGRKYLSVFNSYCREHYEENRMEMFGNEDEGNWVDYLNQRGSYVEVALTGTTWEEAIDAFVEGAKLALTVYIMYYTGQGLIEQGKLAYNYAAYNFNSAAANFGLNFSMQGNGSIAVSGIGAMRLEYAGSVNVQAALDGAMNLANFTDKFPALFADGNGGSGGNEGTSKLIDIDAVRPLLKTEPDSAFFWSGRYVNEAGDTVGVMDDAARIATENGGYTLETMIESKGIQMPEWDINNPASIKAWEDLSAVYANQVSGEVRAVIGSQLREGNIWQAVELPRLKANPKVTKITTIDPLTLVETVIFER